MKRRTILWSLAAAAGAVGIWVLFFAAPRWWGRTPVVDPATAGGAAPTAQRRITATLYYISDDGMSLVPVQREVPFGEPVVEQARQIVEAQLADPPEPLASAVPEGTKLRSIFLTDRGDLFVDLSGEASRNHGGGALDELFTVYTFVNALTTNLPAVQRVQILIDGKESDTLAGHVDLRNPLSRNMSWVKTDHPS